MNLIRHRSTLLAVLLALLFAVPSFAVTSKPRRRGVGPIVTPTLDANINGHLSDATTGLPVGSADIVVEGVAVTSSNRDGDFKLVTFNGRHFVLTAQRSVYLPASTELTGTTGTQSFTLQMHPTGVVVTLRDTSGVVHTIDPENAQFAYLIPFSGYVRSNSANFCKDGTTITPDISEFRRIVGPAKSVTASGCGCPFPVVMQVNIELKTGETATVNFNESCYGNEVDFIGRDHVSGDYSYYNFTNIAEIVFP
jgi:hypothetical protein